MTNEVTLHPAWRQAIEDFTNAAFGYGSVVPHEWFWEHFRIEQPVAMTPKVKADKCQFEFLAAMEAFQKALLEDCQLALRNRRGVGYEVVAPQDQTEWAADEAHDDLLAVFRKAGARLGNVRLDELDDAQRAANAAALARLAGHRAIITGRKLPVAKEPTALCEPGRLVPVTGDAVQEDGAVSESH